MKKEFGFRITLLIAGVVLSVALYKIAEYAAYTAIMAEMQEENVERCIASRSLNCADQSKLYVNCPNSVPPSALDFWWEHRGQSELQSVFDEQYEAENYDVEQLKEWAACKGLLVLKQFNAINVSSPAKYGFTLFGTGLFGVTYGASLEVNPIGEKKIKVRVGFNSL